jgi:RNA polymerase sigma-70 factor (ECF subfamily)
MQGSVTTSPHRPLNLLHDVELAALAAAGDRKAFGELVRRHNAAVRTFVRRLGAAPDVADDIAQDAFLAAFEAIADYRGEGAFVGWVRRIAARLYVKRWRKTGGEAALAEETPAEEVDAHADQQSAARRLDLDEALRGLSEAERLCVSLCYGAGLSHAEAAEIAQAPIGTVKSHVKRGLDKLRRRLDPQGERSLGSDEAGRNGTRTQG